MQAVIFVTLAHDFSVVDWAVTAISVAATSLGEKRREHDDPDARMGASANYIAGYFGCLVLDDCESERKRTTLYSKPWRRQ